MAIPKSFTEKYLKESEGATFFGQKITELTRDELIAMAMSGWKREKEARAEGFRMVKFMRDIRGRR